MSKQEEINKRFDELWDEHCEPDGYCVISPNLFQKDIEKIIKSEISLAIAKKEKEIIDKIKENNGALWKGTIDFIISEIKKTNYKPKQK